MTINQILKNVFHDKRTTTSPSWLEVELLLSFILGKKREWLSINGDYSLTSEEIQHFQECLNNFCNGTPLSYITGKKGFFKDEFSVNSFTLIPRPETELLVEAALNQIMKDIENNNKKISILEVGTGTSCIPISIIKELLNKIESISIEFVTIDISEEALKIADENIRRILKPEIINQSPQNRSIKYKGEGFAIYIIQADINSPGDIRELPIKKFDYIISNPPYIPTDEIQKLPVNVLNEPHIALDGGTDGLTIYRSIIKNTRRLAMTNASYFLEIHSTKSNETIELFKQELPDHTVRVINDLSGLPRILIANRSF